MSLTVTVYYHCREASYCGSKMDLSCLLFSTLLEMFCHLQGNKANIELIFCSLMNDRDYVYKIILSDCQTVKILEKSDI